MAVIHISEAEAASDLRGLLTKVRAGEQVHIAEGDTTIAIVQTPPTDTPRKTLSDAIRWADEQDLQILLDDKFGDDLEQVICNHEHESLGTRWED